MNKDHNLNRFLEPQDRNYSTALSEIKSGHKCSHWLWYIFPQMAGLGSSEMSLHYGITDLSEADDYLDHPVLGRRLIRISQALLALPCNNATQVMGNPDDLKLRSSMSLFSLVPGADPVFEAVLKKYFKGEKDKATLRQIGGAIYF